MLMEDLNNLSNAELRQCLLQCGFANTPVTETTRKILIKKLNSFFNRTQNQLKKQILNATRYSSDEESDIDLVKHRTTNSENIIPRTSLNINYETPYNSTILRNRQTSNISNNKLISVSPYPRKEDQYQTYSSPRIFVPPPITSKEDEIINNNALLVNTPSDEMQNFDENEYELKKNYNDKNNTSAGTPPYRSNFTRRLLNLRCDTLSDKNKTNFQDQTKEYSLSPSHVLRKKTLSKSQNFQQPVENTFSEYNISPSVAFKNVLISLNEQYGVKQTLIPCALVTITIIFFVFLSFLYITITPNLISTLNEKNTILTLCKTKEAFDTSLSIGRSAISCIDENKVNDALQIIKLIIPVLQKKAQEHYCVDYTKSFTMSAKETIKLLQSKGFNDVRKIITDLHNAEYLFAHNPQWHVSHVSDRGELLSFDEVVKFRQTKENCYAILNVSLPLFCSIYNKLQKFFFFIGSLSVILFAFGALYIFYKMILNYRKNKQQSVFCLVDEIINNLIKKAERTPDNKSVVINHLRDQIIPVHKRKEMENSWNKAIHYLENNESRIVFELGVVNGEDCQMLKWIDTVSTESTDKKSSIKKWHSPAFDKTNKIANPPTPCLKIRQMFDKFEINDLSLKQIIQDSILEKVGPSCKIYDIQIDKQSCCVYVRCASEKDAGIVHNEINGWWFDKRLVSIKFLRLERYLSRFPHASAGPKCLYPSNTKKLSMSQCSANLSCFNEENDSDETGEH